MRQMRWLRGAAVWALVAVLLTVAAPARGAKNKFQKGSVRLERGPRMYYWVHAPQEDAPDGLPLVIYLHGSGERGERALSSGLPALVNEGLDFPAVLLVPQLPQTGSWLSLEKQVKAIIETVAQEYETDAERVTLVGFSMGATFGWDFLNLYPELAGRFASICGRLEHLPDVSPDSFAQTWVKTYVGTKDTNVDPKTSMEFTQSLIETGNAAELHVLEATHPQVLKRAFKEESLIQWLSWSEPAEEERDPSEEEMP